MAKKTTWTLVFRGDGMPVERTRYKSLKAAQEAARMEAEEIAGNFGSEGEVQEWGDVEWVVYCNGEEAARWEII